MKQERHPTVVRMIKYLLRTRTVDQLAAGMQCSASTIRAWRDGRKKPMFGWSEIIWMMYRDEKNAKQIGGGLCLIKKETIRF